jgi:gamma-glutamyltranspeptidase/glutathione hydrolase
VKNWGEIVPVKIAIGRRGVTSDHPLATKVGIDVMNRGGNAFDAAIAVSAVLSVVQPQMGGPGGDAFLLGFIGEDVVVYTSAGRSPGGFKAEEFIEQSPLRGPLTVTVPGLVHLWGRIYEEYATLPLDVLLKPAIDLAYSGFYAGWFLGNACTTYESELEKYAWSKYFKGVRTGVRVKNRDAAHTLRLIASRGYDEFYYGELAESIVAELQDQGVNIGLDDFMKHKGAKVSPLKLEIDGKILYEIPPSTQGISTLQLISALYELDLYREAFDSPSRIYKWSEPVARVYTFRDTYIGDPDYMNIDPQAYVKYSSIEDPTELKEAKPQRKYTSHDTTFFIVSDGDSIVGFIQSLFYPFGSGLVAGGFPVQNRAVGFAKRRDVPNSPGPNKTPLHTLSILAVDTDKQKFIIGCVGGDYRPQLHLRAYENLFVYNLPAAKAVEAPRFIYTKFYNKQEVIVEKTLTPPRGVESVEFKVVDYFSVPGHVHIGVLYEDKIELVNDPRSEGVSLAV